MTFAADVARMDRKFKVIVKEVDGTAEDERLVKIGREAAKLADAQVVAALGDMSFSNWRRGRPIPIVTSARLKGRRLVAIAPAPRARGPMRVLTDGRQARDAQSKVSFRTLKSGVIKVRHGKTLRKVGAAGGHGTWEKADPQMRRFVAAQHTKDVVGTIRKVMG